MIPAPCKIGAFCPFLHTFWRRFSVNEAWRIRQHNVELCIEVRGVMDTTTWVVGNRSTLLCQIRRAESPFTAFFVVCKNSKKKEYPLVFFLFVNNYSCLKSAEGAKEHRRGCNPRYRSVNKTKAPIGATEAETSGY